MRYTRKADSEGLFCLQDERGRQADDSYFYRIQTLNGVNFNLHVMVNRESTIRKDIHLQFQSSNSLTYTPLHMSPQTTKFAHVSAPQCESMEDTNTKLMQSCASVSNPTQRFSALIGRHW